MHKTEHTIYTGLSQDMNLVADNSVELVVTSPPYPMIEMWDEIMSAQNSDINEALQSSDGVRAFELMHRELDKVWGEVCRVVVPGGIVCINIGDATRTLNGVFSLHSNHARVINYFINNGFVNLPNILWRKQTNAPNKFMGSGMLPAGAYVTLEHEWILIFRKGGKREFRQEADKVRRRKSSFFWEERNVWFSDLWENLKGIKQSITNPSSRLRSAAYPFDIPYRLINMFSLVGDTVLDPFLGTGTTSLAAIASGRNSIGYDVDSNFVELARETILNASTYDLNMHILERVESHEKFVRERVLLGKELKHYNAKIELPVMTSQEREIEFEYLSKLSQDGAKIIAYHTTEPPEKLITRGRRAKSSITVKDESLHLFS